MKIAVKILLFLTVVSAAAMAEPNPAVAVNVPEPMNLLMAGAGVLAGLRLLRNRFNV
jgi:hypothetical protein